jgi:predicted AAA+ superfamily ATPase
VVFNRTTSIVKSPKLYLADTGLSCALLNIRSEEALRQSPAAGAVWDTFVFVQLRRRESRTGRLRSLFFWRDRTREVDFVAETAGRVELFESKWTEVPAPDEAANLEFVRRPTRVAGGGLVCRTPNAYPLSSVFRALPVTDLG